MKCARRWTLRRWTAGRTRGRGAGQVDGATPFEHAVEAAIEECADGLLHRAVGNEDAEGATLVGRSSHPRREEGGQVLDLALPREEHGVLTPADHLDGAVTGDLRDEQVVGLAPRDDDRRVRRHDGLAAREKLQSCITAFMARGWIPFSGSSVTR